MHLLIILLQQLLGMLPGSKQVPQPEVVRKGSANSNSGEPDACGHIAPLLRGWMTPFEVFSYAASRLWTAASAPRPAALARLRLAAMRASGPAAASARRAPKG